MLVRAGRNPIVAAVLSAIVPGMGQAYAGDLRRGLVLLIGLSAQAALFYGVWMPWLIYGLALVWIWSIYDAAVAARGAKASPGLPALILIVLNLIPAWKITDIHMPQFAPDQRKVVGQIVTSLAKPDFAARQVVERTALVKYLVPGPGAPASIKPVPAERGKPSLSITPTTVAKGKRLTVTGIGFGRNLRGMLNLLGAAEERVAGFQTDSRGRFMASFVNPRGLPKVYYLRAVVSVPTGRWEVSNTLRDAGPPMFQTIYLALVGTVLSVLFAVPLSFLGARNLMSSSAPLRVIYGVTRGVFTILRSVEVLVIAVIAIAVLGIGPFAGVLALAIHGIGALGKLYSEAIESIDHGPIEAVRSTGANDLQVVIFAVVPQVVPQYIAFTLYRWDINVRMATVIGLVGGGGIGYLLYQYMQLFQWREAATAIWLIAGVVMLMDYASAVIRERLV